MAKQNLFNQFTGAWVRQMGRESAHSTYNDLKNQNTLEEYRKTSQFSQYHSLYNYLRLILAQFFLPVLGSVWVILRGVSRLFSKKMLCYNIAYKDLYKIDKRLSEGKRYCSTQRVKIKQKCLKKDFPKEDVRKYNIHAIVYIFIGISCFILQCFMAQEFKEEEAREIAELSLYTKWQTVSITDDFTETTTTYDMVYSTVDSIVNKEVILMRRNGNYILLSTTSSNFDLYRTLDIKTVNGVKTIEAENEGSFEYLTPQNKTIYFPVCLKIPKNLVPTKGEMKIRSKGIIYSFNLNKN